MIFRHFLTAIVVVLCGLVSLSDIHAQIRWTRTFEGQNKVVNFRPGSAGKVVYAVPDDSIGSISISWDGGYHWASIAGKQAPLEPNGRSFTRQLWLDPVDSNIVLLGSSMEFIGMHKSINAGYDWVQVLPDVTMLGESIFEAQDGSGRLYCGTSGATLLWVSTDRGTSWDSVAVIDEFRPNVCVIACRPASGTDFLVGSGGGYISKTINGGKSWKTVLDGDDLGVSDVPMIAFDPKNGNRAWATFYFNNKRSFAKSDDAGETWRDIPARSNQWALKVDPSNPDILYMARFQALDTVGGTFFRSKDGGESWEDLGLDSITDIWQIDYDTTSGRLAMATSNGIFIGETKPAFVSGKQPELEASVTLNFDLKLANFFAPEGSTLDILDIDGRKLLARDLVESRTTIDVADWPTGVYFAHFRHKNGYAIRRFTLLR